MEVVIPHFRSPADAVLDDPVSAELVPVRVPDPAPAPGPSRVPAVTDRDYLAEVREEVNDYLDSHDHVISAEVANDLVTRWEARDPELLDGWLHARSRQLLRDYVYTTSLSRGARQGRIAQQGRFAKFAAGMEDALEGGIEKGREFYRYHSVTEGPLLIRKPLSDLTAKQVGEVRDRYKQAAKDNAFYGRVYEAVRKRVAAKGDDAVVADVYTPEQLENMFDRTTKQGDTQ